MKTETQSAIKKLAETIKDNSHQPHEFMQLAQAALSLAHVLSTLHQIERNK